MNGLDQALDHGLTNEEYSTIVDTLGREPNLTEIGIIGAMWSEHCSYKSSRVHLRRFPTEGPSVLQGPGENAGIVDIGDGLCIAFKMESHNHPSFISPHQGAATGVGGILRDIFTMGARPLAVLDSLRFGDPALPRTRYLIEGVVSGIADYGNCIGIPTIGGEVYFDPCYNGNPLVNVFALGIARTDSIFRGYASGVGNPVIYVGSKTGRDGIHGAVMASESFTEGSEQKRPAVQVGDPFTEKLLLEACLELFQTGVVVGIQDMGAAGLTSSSTEMASRAGTGMRLDMDRVPRRETGMTAYESMLSESQERMLLVVERGREGVVEGIFTKWGLDMSVIGSVTPTKTLVLHERGSKTAELPLSLITDDSPVYNRPLHPPASLDAATEADIASLEVPADLSTALLTVLASPNIASKKWVYEQYDHMVRTNTVTGPGSDSAIIRVKGTTKALAMTTNCNSRYCYLDPYMGASIAVAESARNLACSGAQPLAITDCLNFGSPERPEIMWQFSRAVDGISEASIHLGTPVISGNVSFYNETDGTPVYPTPTIGMAGLIEDCSLIVRQWFRNEGDVIVLLGETLDELGGSEYTSAVHGVFGGRPPSLDLPAEAALISTLLEAIGGGVINSAHDLSEGGLAVTITECCFAPNRLFGASVAPEVTGMKEDAILFSETQSRAVVSADPGRVDALLAIAGGHGTPATIIGTVGGESISFKGLAQVSAELAHETWSRGFEKIFQNEN